MGEARTKAAALLRGNVVTRNAALLKAASGAVHPSEKKFAPYIVRMGGCDMRPLMIEIDPLRSVGPVLLGSSHREAGQALRVWGEPVPYAPYPVPLEY